MKPLWNLHGLKQNDIPRAISVLKKTKTPADIATFGTPCTSKTKKCVRIFLAVASCRLAHGRTLTDRRRRRRQMDRATTRQSVD